MNLQTVKRLKYKLEQAIEVLLEKRQGELSGLREQQKVIVSEIDELKGMKNGKEKTSNQQTRSKTTK